MKINRKTVLSPIVAVIMSTGVVAESVDPERCNHYVSDTCFGIDWTNPSLNDLKGMPADLTDARGRTPLHWAASRSSNAEVIQTLLGEGADINAEDAFGSTPLFAAIEGTDSNEEVLITLIESGADVKNGTLHGAAKNKLWVLETLLYAGADASAADSDNMTPLHSVAFANPDPNTISILLYAGANVNHAGKTSDRAQQAGYMPLHAAAKGSRNPEVIYRLVFGGADLEGKNRDGLTPLHVAADANRTPGVIEAFHNLGADFNARGDHGLTPLHLAAHENYPEMIEAFIEAGADVNAASEDGLTPLHYAAIGNSDPAVLTALLQAGAKVHLRDNEGMTAFDYAKNNEPLRSTDGDGYRMLQAESELNEFLEQETESNKGS